MRGIAWSVWLLGRMKQPLSCAACSDILDSTHKRSVWAQSFAFHEEGFACGDFTRNKRLRCRGSERRKVTGVAFNDGSRDRRHSTYDQPQRSQLAWRMYSWRCEMVSTRPGALLAQPDSLSVGQALAAAKRHYCSTEAEFDYYDEKIIQEATLYGLPMYEFHTSGTMTVAEAESEPYTLAAQSISVAVEGLTRNSVSYEFPEFAAMAADDGVIYTLADQVQIDDGAPIQPRVAVDVTFIKITAHGVVFRGGTYTDTRSFDPVVDVAVTEEITVTEPDFGAPGWYPLVPYSLNRLEDEETLVQVLGQFHPDRDTERLYSRVSFDIYYHDSSTDWTAPAVVRVWSVLQNEEASVSVEATDEAGIHTVVVAHTDGTGNWKSVELGYDGTLWTESFPATASPEFFVQVVDGAGNVAVDDNGGRCFRPGEGGHAVYLPLAVRNQK